MLAYSGRWRLDGDVVTHHVQMSLLPYWGAGEQKRRVVVQADGTIALTARLEDHTPQARTARLVWRRHGDNA